MANPPSWGLVLVGFWLPIPIYIYIVYLAHLNSFLVQEQRFSASWMSIIFSWLVLMSLYIPFHDGCKILDLLPVWLCTGPLLYLVCLAHDTVYAASHGITFFGVRRRLRDNGLRPVLGLSLFASAFWFIWLGAYGHFFVSYTNFCISIRAFNIMLTK